jgi:hypothetical protein
MAHKSTRKTNGTGKREALKGAVKRVVGVVKDGVARRGMGLRGHGLDGPRMSPEAMNAMRDLFWCNVVRDMLNGLSVLSQQQPELFDGRFGVLTREGERIGVRSVSPLFACSIPGSPEEKDASVAVQCTVFQITTPEGEVFTLPVHEIRGMHTMTQELLEKLQKLAEDEESGEEDSEQKPFGLAAFAALPKPVPLAGPGMAEGLGE